MQLKAIMYFNILNFIKRCVQTSSFKNISIEFLNIYSLHDREQPLSRG